MRHTFPAICPLNILWAALLLQSHQFLHRKMERWREWERERSIIQVFTIRPNENPCLEQLPSSSCFLWQLRYKPFECFIFFSFHWFILSPFSVQLLRTPVGRKTAVIKSQLLHLWSLINDVVSKRGEQQGVITGEWWQDNGMTRTPLYQCLWIWQTHTVQNYHQHGLLQPMSLRGV